MFLARGPHGDFDVLPEGGKKLHQAFEGVGTGLAAHQARDVGLPNAEDFSGLGLREPVNRPQRLSDVPLNGPWEASEVLPRRSDPADGFRRVLH